MASKNRHQEADKRLRGRPAGLPSGELQSRLLDAAEQRFGERGYAATSVRSVAEEVGVNPALVHYYFGTKHKLLEAVLDRAFEPLAAAIGKLRSEANVSISQVTELIFALLCEHPALPRLVVREVMLSGGEFREWFGRRYAPWLGGALPPLLIREQDNGLVRTDLDPAILALLILSLCMFPVIARPLAEGALGIDYGPEGLDLLHAHIDTVLECGMMS